MPTCLSGLPSSNSSSAGFCLVIALVAYWKQSRFTWIECKRKLLRLHLHIELFQRELCFSVDLQDMGLKVPRPRHVLFYSSMVTVTLCRCVSKWVLTGFHPGRPRFSENLKTIIKTTKFGLLYIIIIEQQSHTMIVWGVGAAPTLGEPLLLGPDLLYRSLGEKGIVFDDS